MRELPVVDVKEFERAGLWARIAMDRRPALGVDSETVRELTRRLSASERERARFLADPRAYLQDRRVPVASCTFVQAGQVPATSEICSTVTVCNVVAVAGILAYAASVTVTLALAMNVTAVYNWTSVFHESPNALKRPMPEIGNGFGYADVV